MLPGEPDAPLRTTFPERLDILIQLHLSIRRRIARLKRRVRTKPRQLVVLPIRGENRRRRAIGRRGGVSG